ncbi:hypothetical protein BC830DRAFT_1116737 [Chytriomyces sp. MP71]|nr:hypothetical protein BC830DRAFT_1116737 [Chytriomyces sp. MP71]
MWVLSIFVLGAVASNRKSAGRDSFISWDSMDCVRLLLVTFILRVFLLQVFAMVTVPAHSPLNAIMQPIILPRDPSSNSVSILSNQRTILYSRRLTQDGRFLEQQRVSPLCAEGYLRVFVGGQRVHRRAHRILCMQDLILALFCTLIPLLDLPILPVLVCVNPMHFETMFFTVTTRARACVVYSSI